MATRVYVVYPDKGGRLYHNFLLSLYVKVYIQTAKPFDNVKSINSGQIRQGDHQWQASEKVVLSFIQNQPDLKQITLLSLHSFVANEEWLIGKIFNLHWFLMQLA